MNQAILFGLGGAAIGAIVGRAVRRCVWRVVDMPPADIRGPWVEVLGGVAFGAAGALRADLAATLGAGTLALVLARDAVCLGLLLALSAVDLVTKYLPDRLTIGGTVLGLALALVLGPLPPVDGLGRGEAFTDALVGAVAGGGGMFLLRAFMNAAGGLESIGGGDVKLMALVGAFVGPLGVVRGLLSGIFVGVATGVVARVVTGKPHFAFGPALAAGGAIALVAGDRLAALGQGYMAAVRTLAPGTVIGISVVGLAIAVGLMIRIRRRAAEIQAEVDADYDAIDARLSGPAEPQEQPPRRQDAKR